jgi:hypothetical protein
MPEAILKYNLPEEQDDFDFANNGGRYYSVLFELDQYLRNKVKYPAGDTHDEYTNAMEEARKELWSLLESYHLDLDR